jgi:hypothetical protein
MSDQWSVAEFSMGKYLRDTEFRTELGHILHGSNLRLKSLISVAALTRERESNNNSSGIGTAYRDAIIVGTIKGSFVGAGA